MKYPRPEFKQPGIPIVTKESAPGMELAYPKFDLPVTPLENFKLAAARKTPYWVPNSMTDFQFFMHQLIATPDPEKCGDRQIAVDFRRPGKESYTFNDWFNCNWTWVPSAGGAMLTPGTCLCDDITEWEKQIKFPDFNDWDWKTIADDFMKNQYDPTKVLHINIGQGATERLVAVLGGYTEAMLALAMEPEAVKDFLNRFVDFEIEFFDMLYSLYPMNMITYHDDWGTEKDTFFGEKMMEEIVYDPTKRLVDHIRSKDCAFELHCCGNCTRFFPYMIDLGIDFLQIQRRAVNIPAMKEKYGDKIGFDPGLEGFEYGKKYTKEELAAIIDHSVDIYGKNGGYFYTFFGGMPEDVWNITTELFCYSREFYDKERGE